MTSRERVLKSLNFEEPDRVPIDMGSTIMSGIMAHSLHHLKDYLNLKSGPVKVYEIFQMLGEVEGDVIDELGIDLLPVEPLVQFFGLERKNYKPWKLMDGTEVLVPGNFDVEVTDKGDWLLHTEGNITKPVEARMPSGGFYFDMPAMSGSDPDFQPPPLEELKKENIVSIRELEYIAEKAEKLRSTTDKALVLGCWGKAGLPTVGSIPDFLCLMMIDKNYVRDMFEIRTETALKNLELFKQYLGGNIDVLGLDGFDYGEQNNELIPPPIFEELFVPFFKEQNRWIHENTAWKTWLHTCGSVTKIIPMLIDSGLDILNPVQASAAGMDLQVLKDLYGKKLTFWGGGVDTQKTLPFESVKEVEDQVRERIKILAPGGGFVFNTIHNIQQSTPTENIVAAYRTAAREGRYPV